MLRFNHFYSLKWHSKQHLKKKTLLTKGLYKVADFLHRYGIVKSCNNCCDTAKFSKENITACNSNLLHFMKNSCDLIQSYSTLEQEDTLQSSCQNTTSEPNWTSSNPYQLIITKIRLNNPILRNSTQYEMGFRPDIVSSTQWKCGAVVK